MKTLLLIILLAFTWGMPVEALPEWPFPIESDQGSLEEMIPYSPPNSDDLQEIAPPGAVRQIRDRLGKYHPVIRLDKPSQTTAFFDENWELVLDLKDWPLVNDSKLGIGAHVVIQVDDSLPIRVSSVIENKLRIPMEPLTPGSHRFVAYAAYPWGESVKEKGASIQWRINSGQKLQGTQPDIDDPWITIASPSLLNTEDKLLVDSIIWNAPLQGLKEGDSKWRMRVTVNGDSFLLDKQEAIWLKGLTTEKGTVQFELLDGLGEPISPGFNNQLRIIDKSSVLGQSIWMQPSISEIDLAQLIDEPFIEEETLSEENQPFELSEKDNLIEDSDKLTTSLNEPSGEASDLDLEITVPDEEFMIPDYFTSDLD